MFRKLPIMLVLVLAAMLAAVPATVASNRLNGSMDLEFNQAWPGPQLLVPDWVGTLTVGSTDYNMAFFAFGNGKPFDSHPATSSAYFFEEIWKVYESPAFAIDGSGNLVILDPDPVVLMSGYDRGLTNLKNSKFHGNGSVEGAAFRFEEWVGRSVHMRGVIDKWYPFGAPQHAFGPFRIN